MRRKVSRNNKTQLRDFGSSTSQIWALWQCNASSSTTRTSMKVPTYGYVLCARKSGITGYILRRQCIVEHAHGTSNEYVVNYGRLLLADNVANSLTNAEKSLAKYKRSSCWALALRSVNLGIDAAGFMSTNVKHGMGRVCIITLRERTCWLHFNWHDIWDTIRRKTLRNYS